jgi:hypothetical protein
MLLMVAWACAACAPEAKHGAGHYRQNTTRNSHLGLPVICFIEDLLTEPISSECVHLIS